MEHKIFSLSAYKINDAIDPFLEDGWLIKSIDTERVASGVSGGGGCSSDRQATHGMIIIVLEKPKS